MPPYRRSLIVVLPVVLLACGDDPPPSAPTPTPAALVRIDIEGPPEQHLGFPGETLQLRAAATFDNGTRSDVTNEATWTADNRRALTVSARGLVVAAGEGVGIVTASYRERSGNARVRVSPEFGPRVQVTGVVRDAERGVPIVGAYLFASSSTASRQLRTDGNGFFDFGVQAGQLYVTATQFGYRDRFVAVPSLTTTTSLDIRLQADSEPYAERTLSGEFDAVDPDFGLPISTIRIATRGSGVFDVIAHARSCEQDGWLEIVGGNAGFGFVSPASECSYARLRFMLRASDVKLRLRGYKASGWVLSFREPR
ncbi:MAG: hypothetical protein ABIT71_05315 [Vicinamibacteraceae bacterium]